MSSRTEFLVLNWTDIMKLSLDLAIKVVESGYRPDVIVAILRGGYFVAKLIADYINAENLATIEIKFYRGIGEKAERPIVVQPLTTGVRDRKVLIVDDVVDSGRTLQIAIDLVRLYGAKEVRSAALFYKPWSIIMPDYYVQLTEKWIVFPWELGETLRLLTKDGSSLREAVSRLDLYNKFEREHVDKLLRILESTGTTR